MDIFGIVLLKNVMFVPVLLLILAAMLDALISSLINRLKNVENVQLLPPSQEDQMFLTQFAIAQLLPCGHQRPFLVLLAILKLDRP